VKAQCKQQNTENSTTTPIGAFESTPWHPSFYREVTLSQYMMGNDAVVMKVLEVG